MGDRLYFEMYSPEQLEANFPNFESALRRVVTPKTPETPEVEETEEDFEEIEEEIEESTCTDDLESTPRPFGKTWEVEEIGNCGVLDINSFKLTWFKDSVYAVDENFDVLMRYELQENTLVKSSERRLNCLILDLVGNKSGLYAIVKPFRKNISSDDEGSSAGGHSGKSSSGESSGGVSSGGKKKKKSSSGLRPRMTLKKRRSQKLWASQKLMPRLWNKTGSWMLKKCRQKDLGYFRGWATVYLWW